MTDQPHDATTADAKKRPDRTSLSVAIDIVDELKLAWHEECAARRQDIPQQEFTDRALRDWLASRKQAL